MSVNSAGTLTVPPSATVLGKRKARDATQNYVLYLASSPEPSGGHTDSELEPTIRFSDDEIPHETASSIENGQVDGCGKVKYSCPYEGCSKAYGKPSRLAEHERSHTGERPFKCESCDKSYLREVHLQAHKRTHLPTSSRPHICTKEGCEKRFWTSQHLRVHIAWHDGVKPFVCPEADCEEKFAKHGQLRRHIATAHSPPGTKPFQCSHSGCAMSFATSQHLRTHMRVHSEKRYTCTMPACLPSAGTQPVYYATWTALQHHLRTSHPPKCLEPSCNGKTFTSHKGLRAHQKIHEQRNIESTLAAHDNDEPPQKKRRGGELGREWKCDIEGCGKDFKSKKAFTTHYNVTHLGRRDFICLDSDCKATFGYKHLLQRHTAKYHSRDTNNEESLESDDSEAPAQSTSRGEFNIDDITGFSYAKVAEHKVATREAIACPYPKLEGFHPSFMIESHIDECYCNYVFNRAYDLRRHLRATHNLDIEKNIVDRWVQEARKKAEL